VTLKVASARANRRSWGQSGPVISTENATIGDSKAPYECVEPSELCSTTDHCHCVIDWSATKRPECRKHLQPRWTTRSPDRVLNC
jgi:hypothetical protein